jgi:hypothetical protein
LHHGHHVLVSWIGLEDTDESQVVGFSTDDTGGWLPSRRRSTSGDATA